MNKKINTKQYKILTLKLKNFLHHLAFASFAFLVGGIWSAMKEL